MTNTMAVRITVPNESTTGIQEREARPPPRRTDGGLNAAISSGGRPALGAGRAGASSGGVAAVGAGAARGAGALLIATGSDVSSDGPAQPRGVEVLARWPQACHARVDHDLHLEHGGAEHEAVTLADMRGHGDRPLVDERAVG